MESRQNKHFLHLGVLGGHSPLGEGVMEDLL